MCPGPHELRDQLDAVAGDEPCLPMNKSIASSPTVSKHAMRRGMHSHSSCKQSYLVFLGGSYLASSEVASTDEG